MLQDPDRQRIIDRANRLLRQSRTLRKVADELRQESGDLRDAVKHLGKRRRGKRR